MNIRFVETFLSVVDHGSLVEAARRLGLTPEAVAQRMAALENEVGVRLLMRSGRVVVPAEAGVAALGPARKLCQDAHALRASATSGTSSGELRLGAIATALTGIIPELFTPLLARYPQITTRILPGISGDLYRRVVEGDLDAAIVVRPQFAMPKGLEWRLLRSEPLILIAPGTASGRDPQSLLATEPFIRYDRNFWGGKLADRYLAQTGITLRERFELDALDAIAVMVDRGLGVSVVPDWAPPWPAGLSLAKLPLPAKNLAREIGLIWVRSSPVIRLLHAFLEVYDEHFARQAELAT